MERGGIKGDSFGQRRPPLTELVKSILERYPDGGQILKELIQNADDAGATEVKFLYDCRSYGNEYLLHPGLTKFQGPALYAYNDAKFKPEDWEGIQNMMRSAKKDDPLKVGRFGIGFNSVYHVTDFPGIVSGDTVGFLDPHEKYFGPRESGQKYKISDGLLGSSSRDQFAPFHEIYGCDLANAKSYDGTMFRFPLRTEPSELSEKMYTKKMIQGLFDSLHEEASVILLFLKSIQSISVHERKEGDKIKCVFKIEVGEDTLNDVKRERQKLLQQALKPGITESKFVVNVKVSFDSQMQIYKWFVMNQIGFNEQRVAKLSVKLHVLPWVGMAVPINDQAINESLGRIFCFLPLPPDDDCRTGLPVHVHGYFGLTDNRRSLAWAGPDCQNSELAEWNELLLTKIATEVYCKILVALVSDEPRTGVDQEPRSRLVYSSLPSMNQARGNWCCMLKPLFQQLEDQKLFYAQHISGNKWISVKEGIVDHLQVAQGFGVSSKTRKTIISTLTQSVPVITDLSNHVLQIVDRYFKAHHKITPALVRFFIKRGNMSHVDRQEKLLLLGYVLSDGQINELAGLPLLPLENGEFTTFHVHCHDENPHKSVFVPSEKCKAILLPNMKDRFLDGSLPHDTAQKLVAVAARDFGKENPTQLVRLTKEIVQENLRASLPPEWFNDQEKVRWIPGHCKHPCESWLEEVWLWIQSSLRSSLKPLRGVPLIPLPNRLLGVLSQHSRFIFASDSFENSLPTKIIDFLTASGCTVLSDLPSYVRHTLITSYIAPASPVGVLRVLKQCSLNLVKQHVKQECSPNDRTEIRSFLSRLPDRVSVHEIEFLRQLPLFDTLNGTCTAVQFNGRTRSAATRDLRLPKGFKLANGSKIICTSDASTSKLLKLMEVELLGPADIFSQYLFPDIHGNSVYNAQQIDLIMLWILAQMVTFSHHNDRFLEHLKDLPFVPTQSGQRKKAAELFDPKEAVLRDLFAGETKRFPTGNFTTDQVLVKLRDLGLRTRDTLAANDLFTCADKIAQAPQSPSSLKKVKALVEILDADSRHLYRLTNRHTLKSFLRQLKWLPCATTPPYNYPETMPWYHSTTFFAPSEICSLSKAFLIGSSMPTPGVNMSENLQQELGLTTKPPVHHIISQLKTAVGSWQAHQGKMAPMTFALFEDMLTNIYLYLSKLSIPNSTISWALANANLERWIWHGNGFCPPTKVALQHDFPRDLRPLLFLLPDRFKRKDQVVDFFLEHDVRRNFTKEDMLMVLAEIRDKHVYSEEISPIDVERDLDICCAVLKWVVRDGNTLPESLQAKVFVPVQEGGNVLVLEPGKKCAYCDRDWLRREESGVDNSGGYRLIHDSIPGRVAKLLGVPALSTCLLSPGTVKFKQTGPYESITTRLKNILEEYKEGVGVFKELIQNADDAGASKVYFLVDWRHGPKEKLLSPNMAKCQGPALWAYNNAVFTDNDFENINKLAGGTKLEDLAKIGRFGLGFNAVYHLTDVPSFVSREYVFFFDPNVNHLERHIQDKSRPGISISLAANPAALSTFEDQFTLYHNVFGCKTRGREQEHFNYNGTLFRFPFRTSLEAKESKISQSVYDVAKVRAILSSLKESASLLLLFAQHVNEVELFELEEFGNPEKMRLILSVKKHLSQVLRSESTKDTIPFIDECSNWWKDKLTSSVSSVTSPSRCELVTIDTEEIVSDLITSGRESSKRELWIMTSCVGTDKSVRLAREQGHKHGLLPCAGAAAQLLVTSNKTPQDSLKLLVAPALSGEAFCFLPLSIPTGLPVHVNGYFALTSNRMGMLERSTLGRQPVEVLWNECLMEDALANAYIQLLKDVKSLYECGHFKQYDFHALWPRYKNVHSVTWGRLVKSMYSKLMEKALPLFYSDGKWRCIRDGYVLDKMLLQVPEAVDILRCLGQPIFQLPPEISASIKDSGQSLVLLQQTLTLESFLQTFLFPNVWEISAIHRDPVVCFGLDCILHEDEETTFVNLFKENRCITVSEDGRHLAKPCELINPYGAAASLFSKEDYRFPVGEYFLTEKRVYVLERLGMVKDNLSWHEICGRAKSVEQLFEYERGLERARNLIKYLKENVEKLSKGDNDRVGTLCNTKFLPVMSEPPGKYFLPWEGSKLKKQFVAPVDLFMSSDMELVGSSSLIIDESSERGCGNLSQKLQRLLGFSGRQPDVKQVLKQLDAAINAWTGLSDKEKDLKKNMTESICKRVYKYFDVLVARVPHGNQRQRYNGQKQRHDDDRAVQYLVSELSRKPWLFIRGHFVSNELVAYNWNGIAAPFLYGLPYEYHGEYENLLSVVGVKQSFNETDFLNALCALEESKAGAPLLDDELKLTICLLRELKDVGKCSDQVPVGQIPLPDISKVLCRSEELTINLTFWLEDYGDARYVHPDVPQQLALDLGARSLQDRRLEPYSSSFGTPFGQHEKLTDRLGNILKGYPCDSGILKELVQNADDAQATEIHFIYDTRVLPHERVFLHNAREIQGPALCVYNNRPFTEKDFEGIQKLGIGSKREDVEKTGKYGIGFNAVYHLTDCPSLLSNSNTLCILDPHCRYVPRATTTYPGRKFQPIDDKFKRDYPDLLPGYLGQHFQLKDATVFRLPLRTRERCKESLIAQVNAIKIVTSLLASFKCEAKKMLLFLNHVKKISVSVIKENGELLREYEVTSCLDEVDEKQRNKFSSLIKKYKDKPTGEIPWSENTYLMIIRDSNDVEEKWLVNQSCGVHCEDNDYVVPDGQPHCLFPRGGVAALVSSSRLSTVQDQRRFVAYCFLPLPCYTSLPVHVNGHFALDPSRRNLWQDENPNELLTRWNNFMKSRVLAPGYASLILEARNYMPFHERVPNKTQRYFPSETTADLGLHWYHNLFPNLSTVDSAWEILAVHVYRFLERSRAQVLPVVVADEVSKGRDPTKATHKIRCWLSAQEGFFVEKSEIQEDLRKLLLRIHFPLVYTPQLICHDFQAAGVASRLVNPKDVMDFLRTFRFPNSSCEIGKLPCKLEDTKLRSIPELTKLIWYCKKEEKFGSLLKGLPLLFTADGQLRIFDTNNPAYCSQFSDLFPNRAHLFVHPRFVYAMNSQDEGVSQVVRKFTVNALASFMPDIFPPSMSGVTKHVPWVVPENGALSIEWFKRLWDYLQNYAELEQNEEQVSLEALSKWPIIPTKCGKLVTVDNAKTVMDLTESGSEITRQKKIRKILQNVKCPSLNTDITLKKSNVEASSPRTTSFWGNRDDHRGRTHLKLANEPATASAKSLGRRKAVTDPYVAHPHSVADVLQVLDYMRKTGILDVSMLYANEVREILEFFQDDYGNLQPKDHYNKILKNLPLYKALNCTYVTLSVFSSYTIVPSGVPMTEFERLQLHSKCLFLHSDALPALEMLYRELGTGTQRTVSEFYTDFILRYFSIFSQESQMEHLIHVRDDVLPNFPQISAEKQEFVTVLRETRCLPDQDGNLHYAREFYDPQNEVYEIMFKDYPNHFPPPPFQEKCWHDFLKQIGLQTLVSEKQFIACCRKVSKIGDQSRNDRLNVERSRILVHHLFTSPHLHDSSFLYSVSTIKFIASETVEPDLLTIQDQYQCQVDEPPPFVQFRNSVRWKYKNMVWTSAPLLPPCIQSSSIDNYLGILKQPTVDMVVTHLRNICSAVVRKSDKQTLPHPVKSILTSVYTFLAKNIKCEGKEATNECTDACKDIGRHLKPIACILVEEGKVLVRGEQVSFNGPSDDPLRPFLYKVPREYGNLEHLLKRLGATESLTSLQLASVLKAIKDECKEEQMCDDDLRKAKTAMFLFFELATKGRKVQLSNLFELYLPSEAGRLLKSNDLICKVPPRLSKIVLELNYHVLLNMKKCGLVRLQEDDYINSLREELRPVALESLIREELDPSCMNNTCPYGGDGSICDFARKFTNLLRSEEFKEGLERLMKHHRSNKLSEEERRKLARLGSNKVKIKCNGLDSIKIHLVDRKTEKVLEGSDLEDTCFVLKRNDSWMLCIQHEFGGMPTLGFLAKCVNEIIDCCVNDKYTAELTDMLSCSSPSMITSVLDRHNITEALSEADLGFVPPDDGWIPETEDDFDSMGPATGSNVSGASGQSSGRGHGKGGSFVDITGGRSSSTFSYSSPDRNEAQRWIRQSHNDLEAAEFLLSATRPFNALTCFLSHQIVEKSLKAALYAECGLTDEQLRTHNVNQLANDVNNKTEITGHVVSLAGRVRDYYLSTRYPNRQPKGKVPAEEFDEKEARRAVQSTNELLEIVETFVDE